MLDLAWMRTFWKNNALSIAALALFFLSFVGHALTGWHVASDEAKQHGAAVLSFAHYLTSGDFMESVFENWESEFLQMGLFVVLTKFLRQKGSSESKDFGEQPVDADPRTRRDEPNVPGPVKKGGVLLAVYERSLSLALLGLFAVSLVLHAIGGASKYNEVALRHGGVTVTALGYLCSAQFWFESFQNWQSEFLSVAVLILFSVVLRERGSAQSKPVAAPHAATGEG